MGYQFQRRRDSPHATIGPMSFASRGPTAEPVPITTIAASRGFVSPNLREVWAYRELGFFLVWRDVKVRYKQTVFGVLWAVLQPLALMVVFSLFLGRLAGIAPADVQYPVFALAGLVPWTLFSRSLIGASDSLVNAANLLEKVYFPRLLLPIAALGSQVVDFLIAFAVLLLLLPWFGLTPAITSIWLIPLIALILLIALTAGIWLSAINVRYRDVRHVVPLLVQVWLFASPVAYSFALVPPEWSWVYYLNPMAAPIDAFRWALLGHGIEPHLAPLMFVFLVTTMALALGVAYFRRVERTFADVI
jgi:lipopolysaccharide transport system permease protein